MPSGRTHDAITLLLAVPSAAIGFAVTASLVSAAVVGLAFVFGGMMFGPDLDTVSRQYSRWSVLRIVWFPYRRVFRHRSRFSHGLVLGALIRVVYFAGVVTLAAFLSAYIYAFYSSGNLPNFLEFASVWRRVGDWTRTNLGTYFFPLSFLGLWLGAASHTFTDMAGSYIKTGRVAKFL